MSKMENNNSKSGSIGFAGLLALLFIGLKLWGKITWSWLWVLSPIWIPFAILIAWLVFMVIGFWLRVRKLRK